MSPENTHKFVGLYGGGGGGGGFNRCKTLVHGFCFFKLLPIGCIVLNFDMRKYTFVSLSACRCEDLETLFPAIKEFSKLYK